ncbi:DUF5916 domain-containing protein [Longimicrobium sp.]|uniref:DUF5916 domain-containing protein n=1 Tax=Longimicrobium sp. TaxID=2029185 RepID=UPI002D1A48D0|nr:DUF5916 domain-containing protein [Longimicrobium sp.]HSU17008.1 DUF5916 domain-containing protein [Longimicrobium sp.]
MLAALILSASLAADTSVGAAQALTAYRLTAATGAPTIDGKLDDPVWAAADSAAGFVQKDPDEGKPSRFPTVMRVAFDDGAVYVAMRGYDAEPALIRSQLTRRDEGSPSDWLLVAFDSRHDRRSAYAFGVNPAGVKRDFILTDGADDDVGWDAVWDVAVSRDEHGWSAEFRIPLSALRFAADGDGTWGFEGARAVARVNEESYWAPLRKDDSRTVARFGELRGMRNLPSPRRLELLPYTVSSVRRAPGTRLDPFYSPTDLHGSAGLDLKYGLTSDLTLDATVNPDFGQVEADPSQVNLTQYESFFSERRPFFTEGADIFRFAIGLGDGSNESLFYSRRVGRTPHLALDGDYVDQPRQSTILGAAKLSGRVGSGWSVGTLAALTGEERGAVMDGGVARSQVVEPMTGFGVFRARRDMGGGKTQLGFVGTAVHRSLGGTGIGDLPSDAFAGGADFTHRWGNDAWLASAYVLGSNVRGSTDAIVALQESPARYYQRPDASYLRVDSAATSLAGWAGSWALQRVKGRWQGGLLGIVRTPGFEVNDLGYQRDADEVVNAAYFQFRQFNPVGPFRNFNVNFNAFDGRDFGGDLTQRGANVNGSWSLKSYWGFYGGIERDLASISTSALRGGPAILRPASTNGWGGAWTDDRKALNGSFDYNWSLEDQTGGWSWNVSLYANWRPSPGTSVSLSPFYTRNRGGWQYVDAPADGAGSTHYVFADLRQETVGMSARVNQTFSPTLSLQLYAQPFVSAGTYGGFMEVADPRARAFGDRFEPLATTRDEDGTFRASGLSWDNPDFDYRAFNLNAVLRWEYRLGSTMYFAWSHSRDGAVDDGRFRLWHDLDALSHYRATNVFLVKVNWWVSL